MRSNRSTTIGIRSANVSEGCLRRERPGVDWFGFVAFRGLLCRLISEAKSRDRWGMVRRLRGQSRAGNESPARSRRILFRALVLNYIIGNLNICGQARIGDWVFRHQTQRQHPGPNVHPIIFFIIERRTGADLG